MKEQLRFRPGAAGWSSLARTPRRPLPSHHHDELEVNLVLTGKASYLFGQRRVPLASHSMIWLFPRQEHVLIDWSHDFSMWVAVFRQTLVARCASRGPRRILRLPDPGEVLCREVDPRRVDHLHEVFQGAGSDNPDVESVNAALAYGLVASWQAYQFSRESAPRADVHPAVARAARLVSDGEVAPLGVLARAAGLSPSRLSRLFKRQTGVALTAFRQRKGIERFLRLYRPDGRYTITGAALEAGFGSYAQFHRVFCRVMGMSPASYRRSFSA